MGQKIDRENLTDEDYRLFSERLQHCLQAMETLLQKKDFGQGECSLGAELEVTIIDSSGRPLPVSHQALCPGLDPRIQPEVTRFSLEFNLDPVAARGTPFANIQHQLTSGISLMGQATAPHGGSISAIGILPTLRREDLGDEAITNLPRYNLLAKTLRNRRQASFQININGEEQLLATSNSVVLEGSNTSLQLHLRVAPDEFPATFNAAQMVTPLAMAISGNSPYFLGCRLWDETRIALFKQSVDSRSTAPVAWRRAARVPFGYGWVRNSILEQFAESVMLFEPILPICSDRDPRDEVAAGRVPALSELAMHQSTIWQWNRAIFDPALGGHFRLELRALPSGPTPVDMTANSAFLLGATVGWASRMQTMLPGFPFQYAEYNFYRAAQAGLSAQLLWPTREPVSPRERPVTELILENLPVAQEGLDMMGVDSSESRRLLDIIRQRCERGINGARWQSTRVRQLQTGASRDEALQGMLRDYQELAREGNPLHQWPLDEV